MPPARLALCHAWPYDHCMAHTHTVVVEHTDGWYRGTMTLDEGQFHVGTLSLVDLHKTFVQIVNLHDPTAEVLLVRNDGMPMLDDHGGWVDSHDGIRL